MFWREGLTVRSVHGRQWCQIVVWFSSLSRCAMQAVLQAFLFIDVECIYGFVWGGVCRQSRWRHSVTVPHTRWRICVTMATLWQQQDGGCMLLWKRYGNNKMAAILHLQQYSHRLNFFSQAVLVSDFSSGHCWLPTLKCFMISCSLSRKALGWLLTWKVLLPTMLLFHIMLFDALT